MNFEESHKFPSLCMRVNIAHSITQYCDKNRSSTYFAK